MPGDVIVTARSGTVDAGNQTNPSGVQGSQQMVSQMNDQYMAKDTVKQDPDVTNPDVVVVGRRLKQELSVLYINFGFGSNYGIPLPCVGTIMRHELASIIFNMTFTAKTTDYGPGRAGQNDVGVGGSAVPVAINQNALLAYDALPGGLTYLGLHEAAHALKSMQDYNKSMWTAYINGPGKSLSPAQQKAQYPSSAQFAQNEARANTVAKALNQYLGKPAWNWTPTNGYQVC